MNYHSFVTTGYSVGGAITYTPSSGEPSRAPRRPKLPLTERDIAILRKAGVSEEEIARCVSERRAV